MRVTQRKRTDEGFKGPEIAPEVIVDFDCNQDLLYIVVANVGSSSANKISIEFDKEITDFRGKRLSQLDVFSQLEFLAPERRIVVFVDTFSSYIRRKQPLRVSFLITYFDRYHQSRTEVIRHNLAIFKHVVVPDESRIS